MSKPQPPFYELEFSRPATFWSGGDASARRTFLMPVSTPSEFLAFGVQGETGEVHFVARGRVGDELGDFIANVVREQARVELHVWPPLPGWLLRQYVSAPPWEGHEYEEPPESPVLGLTASGVESYERLRDVTLWTAGDALTRRVLLAPVKDPSRFLALGVLGATAQVLFALTGAVQGELGDFIARMGREEARVELYARPPLPESLLHTYLHPAHDAGEWRTTRP